jgi:cell division septal protein FtsQ
MFGWGKGAKNRRPSNRRKRKPGHVLTVTVRAATAQRQRNRRLMYWSCWGVLGVALLGGAAYGVHELLRRNFWDNPEYRVREIRVTTDGSLERERLLEVARLEVGANLFRVNLERASRSLEALPQVARAEIQRVPPDRLSVEVRERQGVAWIGPAFAEDPSTAAGAYLVDAGGVVFRPEKLAPSAFRLPVISGVATGEFVAGRATGRADVAAALELLAANEDEPRFDIRSIDLSRGWCMVATDRSRMEVTFALEEIGWQRERLKTLLDYVQETRREIVSANLMVRRNVPVVFAAEARAAAGEVAAAAPAPAEAAPEPEAEPPARAAKPAAPKPKPKATKPAAKAAPAQRATRPAEPVRRAEPAVIRAEPPEPRRAAPEPRRPVPLFQRLFNSEKTNG